MNPLRHAFGAALLALAWSSAAGLARPAEPSAHSARHAAAPSVASASTSNKASQEASMTSVAPPRLTAAVHATQ